MRFKSKYCSNFECFNVNIFAVFSDWLQNRFKHRFHMLTEQEMIFILHEKRKIGNASDNILFSFRSQCIRKKGLSTHRNNKHLDILMKYGDEAKTYNMHINAMCYVSLLTTCISTWLNSSVDNISIWLSLWSVYSVQCVQHTNMKMVGYGEWWMVFFCSLV